MAKQKAKPQPIAQYLPQSNHVKLEDMDGQTIYIHKMEQLHSEQFGDGWKCHFKDIPGAAETQTFATFSKVLVPMLDGVWQATNKGTRFSLDAPLKATVEVVGRAVTLK